MQGVVQKNTTETERNAQKRDVSIDVLKGFGIILMVIGHIEVGAPMAQFNESFYMPLFYVVSGYLIHTKRPYKDFVRTRLKSLIVPYYVFGAVGLLLSLIFKYGDLGEFAFNMFFFPEKGAMPIVGAIWFLMSMFLSQCIYYLFLKICKKEQYILLLCVLSCVLLTAIPGMFRVQLPLALNTVGISCLYLYFGRLIKLACNKSKSKNPLSLNWVWIAVILAAHIGLCFLNDATNYRLSVFGKSIVLYLVISMAAIIGYWNLLKKMKRPRFLLNYLEFVGKNSIVYLVTNQIVIFIAKEIFGGLFAGAHMFLYVVSKIIYIVLTLAVIHGLVYLFNLRKLKILIGK